MIIRIGNNAWELSFDGHHDQDLFDAGWTVWLARRWGNFYFLRWSKAEPEAPNKN